MKRNKSNNSVFVNVLLPVITVLVFLLVWQLAIMQGWISHKKMAAPVEVFQTFC